MKKYILTILSVTSLALFYLCQNAVKLGLCDSSNYQCREIYDSWERIFSFAPYFVAVALISLFLSDRYFRNWWRFAWWGGPLTIGIIMLVNAGFHHTGGGFMNLDNILDDEIVFLAYFFFGVGSLVQFWRTYKQVK